MKTDDLIRALAMDNKIRAPVGRELAGALAAGGVVAAFLLALVIGVRADFLAVIGDLRFAFKFVVALTLAFTAGALVLRLAKPGSETRIAVAALALAPLLLAAAVLLELGAIDPALRQQKLVGQNWAYCLVYLPFLSSPFLAAALLVLRHGAPTRPTLAGAAAGLLAGGLGAAFYAAHCVDDSPLFVAAWYTLAVLAVTLAGAIIGSRVLRW